MTRFEPVAIWFHQISGEYYVGIIDYTFDLPEAILYGSPEQLMALPQVVNNRRLVNTGEMVTGVTLVLTPPVTKQPADISVDCHPLGKFFRDAVKHLNDGGLEEWVTMEAADDVAQRVAKSDGSGVNWVRDTKTGKFYTLSFDHGGSLGALTCWDGTAWVDVLNDLSSQMLGDEAAELVDQMVQVSFD